MMACKGQNGTAWGPGLGGVPAQDLPIESSVQGTEGNRSHALAEGVEPDSPAVVPLTSSHPAVYLRP